MLLRAVFPDETPPVAAHPSDLRDPRSLLGLSLNSVTGKPGTLAVDIETVETNAGQWDHDFVILSSNYELDRYLKMSTAGNGEISGYGFDGSGEYVRTRKTRKYSVYGAFRVFAATSEFIIRQPVALRAPVLNSLTSGDWGDKAFRENFHEQWCDSFISSSLFGGVVIAIVELSEDSYRDSWKNRKKSDFDIGDLVEMNIRYEEGKRLLSSRSSVQAKIYVRGAPSDPPIEMRESKLGNSTYNVKRLFEYLDHFDELVKNGRSEQLIGFKKTSLKQTDNWPVQLSELDTEEASDRIADLNNQVEEMLDRQLDWQTFVDYPRMFDLKEEDREARRAQARVIIEQIEQLVKAANDALKEVRRRPISYDVAAAVRDYAKEARGLGELPTPYNLRSPAVTTRTRSIKNSHLSGDGKEGPITRQFIPGRAGRWFPGQSRGRLEIVSLRLNLETLPFDLRLSYRGQFRKVRKKDGNFFELIGDTVESEWKPAGERLSMGDDHRLMGIAFRLEGDAASAFRLQYQVHCGRKGGDSAVVGDGTAINVGECARNGQPVEGIRLAISPQEGF